MGISAATADSLTVGHSASSSHSVLAVVRVLAVATVIDTHTHTHSFFRSEMMMMMMMMISGDEMHQMRAEKDERGNRRRQSEGVRLQDGGGLIEWGGVI